MFALTRFEIKKIVAQRRSWAGFLAVAMMNALFALAFYLRNRRAGAKPHPVLQDRLIGEFMNAYVYTQWILAPCMYMLFPIIVAIIGAHILAGETETGSIRLVLCRSVSRWELMVSKFLALCGYCAVMLLALWLTSYAVSATMFKPSGDMIVFGPFFGLERSVHVHPSAEAMSRIILSYALAFPMLMSVCGMALMFSVVTRHFASAAILTSTVYFCSYVVGGIPMLSAIHPFLPTRYLPFWRFALQPEIPWNTIGAHACWTGCYTLGFLGVAIALFNARDF